MIELPYATGDLPPAGGLLKVVPEDFEVEELPSYQPCGTGEHLFLWIEKRGLSTEEAVRELARHGGVPRSEVGYAGQKDRQSISRQFLSLPARAQGAIEKFEHPKLRVLSATRHTNKLKLGHTRGNRFRLRVRGLSNPQAALEILERLQKLGVPNYFGEQRFGRAQDNAERGRKLLLGEPAGKLGRYERRMFLSSLQSKLFNLALAKRVAAQSMGSVLLGDVLKKHESGGEFVCAEPAVDQPRADRFELSPAGPIFGPHMLLAQGEVAEAEALILRDEGLTAASFERGGKLTQGARRHYRVPLAALSAQLDGEDLVACFELPSGSYATVVLRELQKPTCGS